MSRIILIIFFFFNFKNYVYTQEEYFLTLRYDKVNLRQGPSEEYPVKIFYKKKFLPVLIQDYSDNFRKIRDHQNNSGWIHITQLSKRKAALNNQEKSVIFQKPSKYSKPLAVAEKGRLFLIKKCKKNWCKIKTENFSGWIEKEYLNGRL